MLRRACLVICCACASAPAKKVSFEEAMGWSADHERVRNAPVEDPRASPSLAQATSAFRDSAVKRRHDATRGAPMPAELVNAWEGWLSSIDAFIAQPLNRSSALDAARVRLQLETEFENEGLWGDVPDRLVERVQRADASLSTKLRLLTKPPKAALAFGWPVNPVLVTSPFGERVHPIQNELKFHFGVDLQAEAGQPIYAAEGGEVIFAGWNAGHGKQVELLHAQGFVTRYSHLISIDVAEGQHVKKGELLGGAGQTGVATGPHLHFEVRHEGVAEDPETRLPDLGLAMGAASR